MPDRPYNLAIESSCRAGSVTLGRGDEIIESRDMPPQQRHAVDLMPTIDTVCRSHGVAPTQLGEVYLSIGPGSFTGLRIGIATAKMLARVLGVKLVGVPSLDVVAQNTPGDIEQVAVCINQKHLTVYAAIFKRDGSLWKRETEPALVTMPSLLLGSSPRPLAVLGDPLPPGVEGVTVLPAALAHPRSDAVWRLGRAAALRGEFIAAESLLPLYVRPPEAVALWKLNQKK